MSFEQVTSGYFFPSVNWKSSSELVFPRKTLKSSCGSRREALLSGKRRTRVIFPLQRRAAQRQLDYRSQGKADKRNRILKTVWKMSAAPNVFDCSLRWLGVRWALSWFKRFWPPALPLALFCRGKLSATSFLITSINDVSEHIAPARGIWRTLSFTMIEFLFRLWTNSPSLHRCEKKYRIQNFAKFIIIFITCLEYLPCS